MTNINLTQHDTKSYGVKIENNDLIKVKTSKNFFDEGNNILCVKPLEIFLGNCNVINIKVRKFG